MEHILYAHPIIYSHINNLFKLTMQHGHVPIDFKRTVITTVIKYRYKENIDANNYRPVTIISVI